MNKTLNISQHEIAASRIRETRAILVQLVGDLASTKKAVQHRAGKLLRDLDSLRSQLDDELHGIAGFDIKKHDFYYQ